MQIFFLSKSRAKKKKKKLAKTSFPVFFRFIIPLLAFYLTKKRKQKIRVADTCVKNFYNLIISRSELQRCPNLVSVSRQKGTNLYNLDGLDISNETYQIAPHARRVTYVCDKTIFVIRNLNP